MNKLLTEHKFVFGWIVPMFSYGFYRGFMGEYKPPINLVTHRVTCSTINGILYAGPWGIIKLGSLMNRIEIIMFKKNRHEDYPMTYEEFFSVNKRVF
jgi:hypothetical protein